MTKEKILEYQRDRRKRQEVIDLEHANRRTVKNSTYMVALTKNKTAFRRYQSWKKVGIIFD